MNENVEKINNIYKLYSDLYKDNINPLDYIAKDVISEYVSNPYNYSFDRILYGVKEHARNIAPGSTYPYDEHTIKVMKELIEIIENKQKIYKEQKNY